MLLASGILFALFAALLAAALVAYKAQGKHEKSRSTGATSGPRVFSFTRKITLKACPDCREFVPIKASVCKYCGYAFRVAEENMPNQAAQSMTPSVTPPAEQKARQP